jgi:hypothetical protein
LDLDRIVADLKSEQARIGRAISVLLERVGLAGPSKRVARKAVAPKRRGGITPAGRRRLAAAMKARWAARKAKSASISNKAIAAAKPSAPKKRGGGMTPAGRKRLSEMMKKRWAERRLPNLARAR